MISNYQFKTSELSFQGSNSLKGLVFEGNVNEPSTLEKMIKELERKNCPPTRSEVP